MSLCRLCHIVLVGIFYLLLCANAPAQDSLNVTKVGEIAYWDGAVEVTVSGDYAYVASGSSGLRVVDVSDPSNPLEVGYYDTPDNTADVAVSGEYAYVADGYAGLRVVNISDPTNPFEVGCHNTPLSATGVAVSGDYAYVTEGFFGLLVVDVSDPTNPFEVGICDTVGDALDVVVAGDYAYVAAYEAGLHVVDISDPSNLIEVGSCTIPGSANGVTALDDFVFVAASSSGLRVLNISNPTNPYEVGYYNTPGMSKDVAVSGNFAFLADDPYFSIYDCSAAMSSDINVSLTPINPPITIPATGGSFDFNVAIANNVSTQQVFNAWIMVTLPDSSLFGPVLGPVNLTLAAGAAIDRDRTQNVPGGAPAGTYTYEGLVGLYPDDVWDSDGFTFEKLEVGDGAPVNNWSNTGESLDLWFTGSPEIIPSEIEFFDAYPNPFNPTTMLSFQLPVAGRVKLEIFDVNGRNVVAQLAAPLQPDGWYSPGTHHILFDGTGLPSGIYLARLSSGDFTQTQKLVLMK